MRNYVPLALSGAAILLSAALPAAAQIRPAPGGPLGAPTAESLQGFVATDMPPPSSDPRDLNGFYERISEVNAALFKAQAVAPPNPAPSRGVLNGMMCVPSVSSPPSQILQTPGRITFIYEGDHMVRRIYLDRQFPEQIAPTYAGYSIGHWDGDTLVVETRAMKNSGIVRPAPAAAGANLSLRLVSVKQYEERIHKLPNGDLQIDASADGFNADGKPIHVDAPPVRDKWRADLRLLESTCEAGAQLFFTGHGE